MDTASIHPSAASSLAMAVIVSSTAPLLLLDGERTVISASDSFCRAFQLDAHALADRPLGEAGAGEWAVPALASLLDATAAGAVQAEAYEMDLVRPNAGARRLVVNARKLDYGGGDSVRLLVSVADVTDARLAEKIKDDLLREKSILLQELQHRVANSLQIIASVLMQSASRVQSEETRSHLHDAHHRVMSVAALQQRLAASSIGKVQLKPYFNDLCRSIAASMIREDHDLSLAVIADDTATEADVSISLGLIVTELVINALKHAFPDHAGGKIDVGYRSDGPAWTLSVRDNGVGMPASSVRPHTGLGTTIVDALATKLDAKVEVSDARPGTTVSVVHA